MNKKFANVYNLTSEEVGIYPYSWLLDIYTYKVAYFGTSPPPVSVIFPHFEHRLYGTKVTCKCG